MLRKQINQWLQNKIGKLGLVLISLFLPVGVWAQTNGGLANISTTVNLGTNLDLIQTVGKIINVFLGFLGVIALAIVLYAGFLWLTSRGNEEQITKAKKILSGGIIGLVIILASFAIANFIFTKIEEATNGGSGSTSCTTPPCSGSLSDSTYLKTTWVDPSQSNVPLCRVVQSEFNYPLPWAASPQVNNTTFVVEELNPDGTIAGNFYHADDVYAAGADEISTSSEIESSYASFAHPNHEYKPSTRYHVVLSNLSGIIPDTGATINFRTPSLGKEWWFTTGTTSDSSAPTVITQQPADGADFVCRRIAIGAEFSEPMYVPSFAGNVLLQRLNPDNSVAENIPLSSPKFTDSFKVVSYNPIDGSGKIISLLSNSKYKVTVNGGATGVKDACLIPLAANSVWTFTTGENENCEPIVTDTDPKQGYYSDTITVTGHNFFNLVGEVYFNNFAAASNSFPEETFQSNILCWNGDSRDGVTTCANEKITGLGEIKVRVPVGATTGPAYDQGSYTAQDGNVKVSVGRLFSNAQEPFRILSPYVEDISPTSGGVGQWVSLNGWNFGAAAGTVKVGTVNAVPPPECSATWSDTSVVVAIPDSLTPASYALQLLTAANNRSNQGWSFKVTTDPPGPGICSVSSGGASIADLPDDLTIIGKRFGSSKLATSHLLFDNYKGTILDSTKFSGTNLAGTFTYSWSDGQIDTETPTISNVNALGVGKWWLCAQVRIGTKDYRSNCKLYLVSAISTPPGATTKPPQVVYYPYCSKDTPSPSPFNNNLNVCRDALVMARFTLPMDETTFTKANIKITRCNQGASAIVLTDCNINVDYDWSTPHYNKNGDVDGFALDPLADLEPDYWYRGSISNQVASKYNIKMTAPYDQWYWKVSTTGDCPINSLLSSPSKASIATGTSRVLTGYVFGPSCVAVDPEKYSWNWDENDVHISLAPTSPLVVNQIQVTGDSVTTIPAEVTVEVASDATKQAVSQITVGEDIIGVLPGPPKITAMTPTDGRAEKNINTTISITGANFGASGSVWFTNSLTGNRIQAVRSDCGLWTNNKIIINTPNLLVAGVNMGDTYLVEVVTSRGTSRDNTEADAINPLFTLSNILHPSICSMTPNYGPTGTSITIRGYNFSDTKAAGRLYFPILGSGSVPLADANLITKWSNKEIIYKVPANPISGLVWVGVDYNGDGSISPAETSNDIDYFGEPVITDIIPNTGPAGTWVTIKGRNFGYCTALGLVGDPCSVTFTDAGGALASADPLPNTCSAFDFWTDRQIIVKVPNFGAGEFASSVTINTDNPPDLLSNSKEFNYNSNLPLGPGLCGITPITSLKSPLPVASLPYVGGQLLGEYFGATKDSGSRVNFSNSGDLSAAWLDTSIGLSAIPASTISGEVTVQKNLTIVTGQVCNFPKIQFGDTCIGGWDDATKTLTLVSNPVAFYLGDTGTTGPTVGDLLLTSFSPVNNNIGICRNSVAVAKFDKEIKPTSVNSNSVYLETYTDQRFTQNSFEEPNIGSWQGSTLAGVNWVACDPNINKTSSTSYDGTYSYNLNSSCFISQTKSVSNNEDYIVGVIARGVSAGLPGEIMVVNQSGPFNPFAATAGSIINRFPFNVTTNWRVYYTTFNTGSAGEVSIGFRTYAGPIYIDKVFWAKVNKVNGRLSVNNDSVANIGTVIFQPDSALSSTTWYRLTVNGGVGGVMAKDNSLLNCALSPAGCVTNFVTGSDICKLFKITISPSTYSFTKANEQASFSAQVYAADNQPLAATYNWSITPEGLFNIAPTSPGPATQVVTNNKNGLATLKVNAVGTLAGSGTLEIQASLDAFLCEVPWELDDGNHNFKLRYCRSQSATTGIDNFVSNGSFASGTTNWSAVEGGGTWYSVVPPPVVPGPSVSGDNNVLQVTYGRGTVNRSLIQSIGGLQKNKDYLASFKYYFSPTSAGAVFISAGAVFIYPTNSATCEAGVDHYKYWQAAAIKSSAWQKITAVFNTGDSANYYLCLGVYSAGDLVLPAPVLFDQVEIRELNGALPELKMVLDSTGEKLFQVVGTKDVIGLKSFGNPDRLTPQAWLKTTKDGSAAVVTTTTLDGYPAARGGQTVYVSSLNIHPDDLTLCPFNTVCGEENLLSYNTGAGVDSQNIYNQLLTNWVFNTNLTSDEKIRLQRDMKRLVDLNTIEKAIIQYGKVHNYNLPQLNAGTYVPKWSTSAWNSWQQTLASALGKTLPVDPINIFNACAGTGFEGFDAATCWNEASKEFKCPDQSFIYMYQAADSGTARLYFNPEFRGVSWEGTKFTQGPAAGSICTDSEIMWQEVSSAPPYKLSVFKNGGTGTVVSEDTLISCGSTCDASYSVSGQRVKLSAIPSTGTVFSSWSGCSEPTADGCIVVMDQDLTVTANFATIATYTLEVARSGSGSGTIISTPTGINCGTTCSASFNSGSQVSLLATPDANSTFVGWTGCNTVENPEGTQCNVSMSGVKSVVARFVRLYKLTTSVTGIGTVSAQPVGISCNPVDPNCAQYISGSVVTLTATPGTEQVFKSWSGCDTVSGVLCTVTMSADKTVNVIFEPQIIKFNLNVSLTGTGAGLVTSADGAIDCGSSCTASYTKTAPITIVTLQAFPGVSSQFSGWSGSCAVVSGTSCQVNMDDIKSVVAEFTLKKVQLVQKIDGAGVVASDPVGTNCAVLPAGSAWCHEYNYGQLVTLNPIATLPSEFTGWSSDDLSFNCGGTGTCTLTMNKDVQEVTATFALKYQLTVNFDPVATGAGRVVSEPAGIDCGSSCDNRFVVSEPVKLFAIASPGSSFTNWVFNPTVAGAVCAEGNTSSTCTFTYSSSNNLTATARFSEVPSTYNLSVEVDGPGTVTGSGTSSINCNSSGGPVCASSFAAGSTVTLIPVDNAGSVFDHWLGCTNIVGTDCIVNMTSSIKIEAYFNISEKLLTVVNDNTAGGEIRDTATFIRCGVTCTHSYPYNAEVTLEAYPTGSYTFAGWSGACSGTGTCTVTMDDVKTVHGNFVLPSYILTVTKSPISSAGTVTVQGVACDNCSAQYPLGTDMVLTAAVAGGYNFVNWTGVTCDGGNTGATCNFKLLGNTSVTANFSPIPRNLQVNINPVGTGTVTATGINCPGDCMESYDNGSAVRLTATPGAGNVFISWTGVVCSGGNTTNPCNFSITANTIVTANFAVTHTLTVTTSGTAKTANTYVTSTPVGISCESDCTENYSSATTVTLRPQIDVIGTVLWAWSGACTGNNQTCLVAMSADRTVNAQFEPGYLLTVNRSGTGTVTGTGISCGTDCTEPFSPSTNITLVASTGSTSWSFDHWTGCTSTNGVTCYVTMSANRSVTAFFTYTTYSN